jgi:putative CocE/NonD family hydrolase
MKSTLCAIAWLALLPFSYQDAATSRGSGSSAQSRGSGAAAPASSATTDAPKTGDALMREAYTKREVRIPMRDGVKLFTSIYAPRDASQRWPILLRRTPYSVKPYGEDKYPESLGPSELFAREKYVFAYQDVRGTYMSEGEFVDMRPQIDAKKSAQDVDESSDTWDTIDWLVKNVENNNERVGMSGISYPGFYAAAGMIDAHPALKAVSPQAPIADWFFDDFHHHGALFLPHAFNFLSGFGQPRPTPTTERPPGIDHKTSDGYQFFLDLGPLSNANERYFKGNVKFWNDLAQHPNYDAFWQARNLQPHLKHVAPAVMTVGGWFDAEDLYGALNIYRSVETQNANVFNVIVMGPWPHGGWSRSSGESLGNVDFGAKTSEWYRANLELPFFEHFLKDKGELAIPEASMFDTGANAWRTFDHWPPQGLAEKNVYLLPRGRASFVPERVRATQSSVEAGGIFDEFVSDPAHPVPFTEVVATGMTREYMTDDQRFAARRADVLTWQTDALDADMTLAGPLTAELTVSTTGTDADWIVKLVDVFPPDAKDNTHTRAGEHMSGYQMMVRSEVIRGRFRKSIEKPEPFTPNEKTPVELVLQDVLHTFQRGHRLEIQVQCTWFPLVDRNPQKYVDNIFEAREEDFVKATQRVWHGSYVRVGVLPAK